MRRDTWDTIIDSSKVWIRLKHVPVFFSVDLSALCDIQSNYTIHITLTLFQIICDYTGWLYVICACSTLCYINNSKSTIPICRDLSWIILSTKKHSNFIDVSFYRECGFLSQNSILYISSGCCCESYWKLHGRKKPSKLLQLFKRHQYAKDVMVALMIFSNYFQFFFSSCHHQFLFSYNIFDIHTTLDRSLHESVSLHYILPFCTTLHYIHVTVNAFDIPTISWYVNKVIFCPHNVFNILTIWFTNW